MKISVIFQDNIIFMKEKSFIVFVIVTLLINTSLSSQTADHKVAYGISGISTEYYGDYGIGFLRFDRIYAGLGLSMGKYLSPSFDMGVQGSLGKYGYFTSITDRFYGNKFDLSIYGHYKLNNGHILGKYDKLSPFFSFGLGFATYSRDPERDFGTFPTIITGGVDLILPVGVGLKYQISESLALQYQYQYNFTSHDDRDENRRFPFPLNEIRIGNDAYGKHIISLVFSFVSLQSNDCYCQ